MSFVDDQFTAINGHLDRVEADTIQPLLATHAQLSSRASKLQSLINAVNSIPAISRASTSALTSALRQADFSEQTTSAAEPANLEQELEWLLLSKVALATHGIVLDAFLNWTIPVNDDIWYWTGILDSYAYTGLYSIQTAPIRFYGLVKDAYAEARTVELQVTGQWNRFYDLVHKVAQNISAAKLRKHITSPLVILRAEIRLKREVLERIKSGHASAIGLLMTKSFTQRSIENDVNATTDIQRSKDRHKLKRTVKENTEVLAALLKSATTNVDETSFDYSSAEFLDREIAVHESFKITMTPSDLSSELYEVLQNQLPTFNRLCALQLRENGRPPRIVRYWLPVTLLTVFSGTILRIALNRQASIQQWIREFGDTVIAFWSNWVVDPTRRLIGTIRHDSASEISILSKRSLEGDRASLERMVVDFAIANPDGPALQEADIADLRAKVAEGDLTPVLKAYEKDLQSPFMGTIRGNLVRALLIQVQKTKVDVEVAMGGIDSLLKSQELVFGFVGLTPGILVCIAAGRYLSGIFSNRRGTQRGAQKSRATGILRNMDRILTMAPRSKDSKLSYKEQGLLVCEALALRTLASRSLAKQRYRELVTDIDDLIDIDLGVERQTRIVDRIRWAYTAWL